MSACRFVPSLVLVVLVVALQLVQFSGALNEAKRSPGYKRSHGPRFNLDTSYKLATSELLLLTDGQHIKLYPLISPNSPNNNNNNKPLVTSGGYYVIKNRDLTLSSSNELSLKAPRYKKWLEYKQRQLINNKNNTHTQVQSSILPTRRGAKSLLSSSSSSDQRANEQQLYSETSIWKKPFITQVGTLFLDPEYCNNSKDKLCLVIYWLDSSNSIVHFGALKLNDTKLDLLETHFDSNGTTGAKHDDDDDDDRPTIWLQQLMPYEINTNLDNCKNSKISQLAFVNSRRVNYVVNCNDNHQEARLFTATLESSTGDWSPPSEIYDNKQFGSLKRSINLKNLIASNSLIYLDNAKINVLEPMGESHPLIDVQWETTKAKVRRMNSHKLEQPFSVIDMVIDKSTCGLYWLTSDHELYSSDAGAINQETKFAGKLESRRPLIREPITSMQILHNTLFFMDATRRSLMAYKLPAINQRYQPFKLDKDDAILGKGISVDGDVIKDKRVPKLTSTHQVLLVEMLIIQDFALVNLNERSPNSCQVLSEIARRNYDNNTGQLRKSYNNNNNNEIIDNEYEQSKRNFERLIREQDDDNMPFEPIKSADELDTPQRTKLYVHPVAYVHLIFAFLIFALVVLIIFVGLYMELRKRKLHASDWESSTTAGEHADDEDNNRRQHHQTSDQVVSNNYKKPIGREEKLKHQEAIRMA